MAKKNPNRIPRTQVDVDRAFMEGMNVGTDIMCNIFLSVLLDKHGATQEELDVFAREVEERCRAINDGYLSYADINRILREDYNFKTIPLTRRLKI